MISGILVKVLSIALLIAVGIVLILGIGTLFKGGETSKKYSKKLMPLIHLPVQSGSTKILKSMNRNHTVEEYLEVINKLKAKNPAIKFSSDFIIGYPGETDGDFNDTLTLLKEVGFINSYSFIFSPRPGTPAAKMKLVDNKLAKERLLVFQKKANEIKLNNIFDAVDEKVKTVQCKKESKKGCNGKPNKCLTHNLWDELENHINEFFEKKSLEDLIKDNIERRI